MNLAMRKGRRKRKFHLLNMKMTRKMWILRTLGMWMKIPMLVKTDKLKKT